MNVNVYSVDLAVLGLLAWTLGAIFLIGWLGVAHRRDEFSAARLGEHDSAGILFYILITGAFVWLMTSLVYAQYIQLHHGVSRVGPSTTAASMPTTTAPVLSSNDLIFLSIVPPLLGVICLWLLDRFLTLRGLETIGLRVRRLPAGLGAGLLGIFITMPLVFWSGQLVERLYALWGLHTPTAHELLRTLHNQPTDWRIGMVMLAAVVIAPLFEETLFRGHLQTLLRHILRKLMPRLLSERAAAWTAIICTAAAFAAVHPHWMSPMIFVLALGLGYAYERTGNLWTSITMHALFNLLSIWQYLLLR